MSKWLITITGLLILSAPALIGCSDRSSTDDDDSSSDSDSDSDSDTDADSDSDTDADSDSDTDADSDSDTDADTDADSDSDSDCLDLCAPCNEGEVDECCSGMLCTTGWDTTEPENLDVCVPVPLPDWELCPELTPSDGDPCEHVGLECLFPDLICRCKCPAPEWVCDAEEPAETCDPTTDDPEVACLAENACCDFPIPSESYPVGVGEDSCFADWTIGLTTYSVFCEHLGTLGAVCECSTSAG
jgi:hypothetical protein